VPRFPPARSGWSRQIDAELRELGSGLMNDEKRDRIEKLKAEKRKNGKKLRKLQSYLP
jgi:hypothetical protein